MLFSTLLLIVLMVLMFKITGFIFGVLGKLLGWVIGILGWLILAVFAVTAFGLTIVVLPIVLAVGLFSIIMAIAS